MRLPGTYISPAETGLYYLQSRYYNPEWGRFINADAFPSTGQSFTGNNMFAYCGNNPVTRKDIDGYAWETIFDVLSLGASIMEVAFNPADPFAWLGLAGDAVDLIPFITGVGETIRALKTASKVADAVDNTYDAIDTYRDLKKVTKGTGLEVHHIVEKRFGSALKIDNTNTMYSIALNKTDHRLYTNEWRKALSYGSQYTKKQILNAAIQVYSNDPQLLGAALVTILK